MQMNDATAALRLDLGDTRRVMARAQGLVQRDRLAGLVPTLERTGFVRTLGGADVYIAARARVPGLTREALDQAVGNGLLRVVPAVRGCIYLVPGSQAPLALAIAERLSARRIAREHERAGIEPGEIDALAGAILRLLKREGPLSTHELRRELPDGNVRSLGEAGKKVGLSSTLPPALRHLEFSGAVERGLEVGRLDTERYTWETKPASASASSPHALPADPVELFARAGEIFFRAAGIARADDFTAWLGCGKREGRAALDRLPLIALDIEGWGDTAYALEELRPLLESPPPPSDAVSLLPFEDNLIALHGGPRLLVDKAHHAVEVPVWGRGRGTTLGDARHMSLRSVVVDGEIVGFWEYDPDSGEVVTACFGELTPVARGSLADQSADLGRFLREEIGHGKSYSLDTEKAQRRRVALLRARGG